MTPRVRGAMIGALALLLGAVALPAQSLDQRVARAPDGAVRFSYAARPGVFFDRGRDRAAWRSACDSGPVRISLVKRGGTVSRLDVAVGGSQPPADGPVTDLGLVGAAAAANYLLALAGSGTSGASDKAIFAATLADSVTIWPELLALARDERLPRATRRSAVFWLGHAAGDAATRGLDDLVAADTVHREIREAAVFALSQRPPDEGVPALIRIVRSHRDPEIRRKALFWLGQSEDPRALALFEEILAR